MREQLADFIIQHESRVDAFGNAMGTILRRSNLLPEHPPVNGASESMRRVLSDRDAFSRIRTYSRADVDMSPTQRRQAQRLYRLYLAHQCEPRLDEATAALEGEVRMEIQNFRCDLGSGPLGWDDIWPMFVGCDDVRVRREAWSKLVDLADHLAPALLEVVASRNRAARAQGFDSHFELALALRELDTAPVEDLLRDAAKHTHKLFGGLKDSLDKNLADWFGTRRGFMGPWHYPHPMRLLPSWDLETNLPPRREAVSAALAFLRHRGLSLAADKIRPAEVTGRSPKPDPWATLVDVGRVLVKAAEALFEAHADPELPETLRSSPHPVMSWALWYILVEEIASPDVLEDAMGLKPTAAAKLRERFLERHRRETLLLVHHGLATVSFEKALYANPGQDLTALWWGLLKQSLRIDPRDEGGHAVWAIAPEVLGPTGAGIERTIGAMIAAQIRDALPPNPAGSDILRHREGSAALKDLLIRHAGGRSWTEHVSKTTGLDLSSDALIKRVTPGHP